MENSMEVFQGQANTSSVDTRNPYDFDSVSMCSYQSTVYDSEFVAAEVKRYERNRLNQNYQASVNPSEVQNNQINLSINLINASNL